MSESVENAVQIAVYVALSESAELTGLLADYIGEPGVPAIYDRVPQSGDTGDRDQFPYIVIGEESPTDWSTDTASGFEVTTTIHSWSRAGGRREIKQVMGAIYNAMHRAELTTPDHEFIGCEFDNSSIVMDPDMITHHGVSEFRITVDEPGYGV